MRPGFNSPLANDFTGFADKDITVALSPVLGRVGNMRELPLIKYDLPKSTENYVLTLCTWYVWQAIAPKLFTAGYWENDISEIIFYNSMQ